MNRWALRMRLNFSSRFGCVFSVFVIQLFHIGQETGPHQTANTDKYNAILFRYKCKIHCWNHWPYAHRSLNGTCIYYTFSKGIIKISSLPYMLAQIYFSLLRCPHQLIALRANSSRNKSLSLQQECRTLVPINPKNHSENSSIVDAETIILEPNLGNGRSKIIRWEQFARYPNPGV